MRVLTDAEQIAEELTRFATRKIGFHRINAALTERGWRPHDIVDGRWTDSWAKNFTRGRALIVAKTKADSGAILAVTSSVAWQRLSPIVVSEFLFDLEHAVGVPRGAEFRGA